MLDAAMIERGLEKTGKSKGGLAAAMGVRPGAVSEILGGERLVKASEIIPIMEYLELNLAPIQLLLRSFAPDSTGAIHLVNTRGAPIASSDGISEQLIKSPMPLPTMKKLRERDQDLLETCYGRSIGIRDVARARGRSAQSIHNSLRRIRRALFECVRRSLAQGGTA